MNSLNLKYCMRTPLSFAMIIFCFFSCGQPSHDYALKWSNDIKSKILEDANVAADSIAIDSSEVVYKRVILYNKGTRTKSFGIRTPSGDTLVSIFYSKDQYFELVRELCPAINRSFEGIKYRGTSIGLAEFRFCDGKLKEQGYRFGVDVGVWKEWDEQGKLINEKDNGRTETLDGLRDIKYYR